MPCITVTNFSSEGKVMLLLRMVRYQGLLGLDTYDTDAFAIDKRCKLNFRSFTIHLAISQQHGQGF